MCAPGRFIEAGSATSELSLNDTSSQNICIDTRCRAVVLDGTVSDRGDSVTLNTEDLLVSAALSVPYVYTLHTYIALAARSHISCQMI